jgi:hypothetical protein
MPDLGQTLKVSVYCQGSLLSVLSRARCKCPPYLDSTSRHARLECVLFSCLRHQTDVLFDGQPGTALPPGAAAGAVLCPPGGITIKEHYLRVGSLYEPLRAPLITSYPRVYCSLLQLSIVREQSGGSSQQLNVCPLCHALPT